LDRNANESEQFRIVDEVGGLKSYRKEEKIKRLRKFECWYIIYFLLFFFLLQLSFSSQMRRWKKNLLFFPTLYNISLSLLRNLFILSWYSFLLPDSIIIWISYSSDSF